MTIRQGSLNLRANQYLQISGNTALMQPILRSFIDALVDANFTPAWFMRIKKIRISLSVTVILAVAVFVGLRYWPADKAPNIVLITIDTLRADHLDLYGYPRKTAPSLTELASRGVTFDHAVSQAPWTLPSIASLLTSLYPSQHGVTQFASTKLPDDVVTNLMPCSITKSMTLLPLT